MITTGLFLLSLAAREAGRWAAPGRTPLVVALDRIVLVTGLGCAILLIVRFVALVQSGA